MTPPKNGKKTKYNRSIKTKEGLWTSFSLLISAFRYWEDGVSSTALVDSTLSLVAFFDRGVENTTILQYEGEWDWNYILSLEGDFWEKVRVKEKIEGKIKINLEGKLPFHLFTNKTNNEKRPTR